MKWVIFGLFCLMPLLAVFSGWQAVRLLSGRKAFASRRLTHLPPHLFSRASRDYGYMCAALAASLVVLPVVIIKMSLGFSMWSQLLTIVCSGIALWSWALNRRYGKDRP